MDVYEATLKRRAIRRYQNQPVIRKGFLRAYIKIKLVITRIITNAPIVFHKGGIPGWG